MRPQNNGLCECGCGETTRPAAKNDPRYGYVKGQPQRFVFGHQLRSKVPEYRVDTETGCWIWQRATNRTGYGIRSEGLAHRFAYERANGPIPEGFHLDHACRNPSCVNPAHLRVASPAENASNRSPRGNRGSASKFRGVYRGKAGRWHAKVTLRGEAHYLGSFYDEEQAGMAAAEFRRRHMPFSVEASA